MDLFFFCGARQNTRHQSVLPSFAAKWIPHGQRLLDVLNLVSRIYYLGWTASAQTDNTIPAVGIKPQQKMVK